MNFDLRKAASITLQLAALSTTLPIVAHSQAGSGALEEIIVTAQRREQNLQEIGVSVTALGSEQIRDLGITNSLDIARVAPSVVFASTASGSFISSISIRGIAQTDYSAIQEAPNSMYIDDVYVSANGALSFATYDLDRIEVLRGPQGTLFGRNSTGGLANFITARPTESFEGYAELGAGDFNQFWVEGAVSGPLTDRVRGRLSFKGDKADGWWKNHLPGGKDAQETDSLGVRGQLEVDLTDNLLARLSINYASQPKHAAGGTKPKNFYFDENGVPAAQPANLDAWGTGPGNNLIGYRDPYPDNRESAFQDIGFSESDWTSPTLMLQWSVGSTTLVSLTNYTDFDASYREDLDGSPIDFARDSLQSSMTQWSQEFRAYGSLGTTNTWTAGLYYLDIDTFVNTALWFPGLAGTDFAFDSNQNISQRTRTWAPYGQIEWALTDTLRLTTGVRYTQDEKTIDSQVYFRELGNGYSGGTGSTVFPPPGLLVYDFQNETVGNLAKQDEGLWSGKVQLDYKPTTDLLLYAGISRGVKGAGFNSNLGGGMSIEETPFRSEAVLAYEIGGKSEFLDNQLRVNSSVYYYDYDDYQGYAFNGIQGVVGNYKGEFYGGELEVLAQLPGDLGLSLGGSYSHTLLKDIPTAYTGIEDQRAVMAPEWMFNGSLRKSMQVGPGNLAAIWSFDYVSDRYASVENNPATYLSGSTVHNLRLTYAPDAGGLEFSAFVNNVADEERHAFVYDLVPTGGFTQNIYDKPRWWGVSVRKSF